MSDSNVPARKPVSKRLRFETFRRDGYRCRYCGTPANESGEGLTVDHVVPVALGGGNEPGNLLTACKDCNNGKASASPDDGTVADVAEDAIRWAQARKLAAEESQADATQHEPIVRAFAKHWKAEDGPNLPGGWRDSIRLFAAEGMSRDDLLRYADTAISRTNRLDRGPDDVFAYFCGICWKVINERQRRAVEIASDRPSAPVSADVLAEALTALASVMRCHGAGFLSLSHVALAFENVLPIDEITAPLLAGWNITEAEMEDDAIEAILESWGGAIHDTWVDV